MKRRLGTFLLTLLLLLALSPAALAAEPVRVAVIDTGVSSAVVDYANHALSKNYILPGQSTETVTAPQSLLSSQAEKRGH